MSHLRKDTVSLITVLLSLIPNIFSAATKGREAAGLLFIDLSGVFQDYGHIMQIFNQSLKIVSKRQLEAAFLIYYRHCYNSTQEI